VYKLLDRHGLSLKHYAKNEIMSVMKQFLGNSNFSRDRDQIFQDHKRSWRYI